MPDDINSRLDVMGDINDRYAGTRMTHMADIMNETRVLVEGHNVLSMVELRETRGFPM